MTHHLNEPRLVPVYDEAYWDALHHAAYVARTRCPECRRLGLKHFPKCSKAPRDQQYAWKIRDHLRELRWAPRVWEDR